MEFLRLEIDRPALPVIAGVVHFDGKSGAGGHVNGKGGEGKGREGRRFPRNGNAASAAYAARRIRMKAAFHRWDSGHP